MVTAPGCDPAVGGSGRPSPAVVEGVLDAWTRAGRTASITSSGTSMLPLIRPGDRLVLDCRLAPLAPGDVIAFRRSGHVVAHRLVRSLHLDGRRFFLTRGDNAAACDPPVPPEGVLGRVILVERGDARLSLDAWPCRCLGRAIAASAVALPAPLAAARRLKQGLVGRRRLPVAGAIRRLGRTASASLVRLAGRLLWRVSAATPRRGRSG